MTSLNGEVDAKWQLPGFPETFVTTGEFQGRRFVNIRVWAESHPTKNGVTLSKTDFDVLETYLNQHGEVGCMKEAYRRLIREKASNIVKLKCEGCRLDCPSQKDHACCFEASDYEALHSLLRGNDWREAPTRVIEKAAQIAHERNILLSRPLESLDIVQTFLKNELLTYCGDCGDEDEPSAS